MYVEAYETLSESLLQHALCRVCNRSLYIIMQHRLHAFGHRVVSCWVRPRPRRSAPRIATSSSLVRSNNGSPRFTDFPSLCACSESILTNLIGSGLNLLCLQIHSKPKCRWTWPEVAILGADQKKRRLWGRKCVGYWKLNQWACPSLDYQPLFRNGACAPTPGRNVDQTRESGGNRAKGCPGATLLHESSNIGKTTTTNQTKPNQTKRLQTEPSQTTTTLCNIHKYCRKNLSHQQLLHFVYFPCFVFTCSHFVVYFDRLPFT